LWYNGGVSKSSSSPATSLDASDRVLDGDTLLTVTDVSRALSVHRTSVYAWITSGRLPALDFGSASLPYFKVRRSDLDAFLAAREVRVGADS
jgi:excisionase family DNA binding protein